MTKLIAVHSLILASDVKGVVDQIEPGKAFTAREDELSLIERGAARKPHASEKDMTVVARASKTGQGSSVAVQAVADPAGGLPELGKMTKAQLAEVAREEEIEMDDDLKRDDMQAAIEAGRAAKADLLVRKDDDLV